MDNSDLANNSDFSGGMMVKCVFSFIQDGRKVFRTARPLFGIPPMNSGVSVTTEDGIIFTGVITQIDLILDNRLIHNDENIGDCVAVEVKVFRTSKAPTDG